MRGSLSHSMPISHGSDLARHLRRKAVNCQQGRRAGVRLECGQPITNGAMVGPVERVRARLAFFVGQTVIAGHRDILGPERERSRVVELAVAVDHEPRISAQHRGQIHARAHCARDVGRADVDREMGLEIARRNPEHVQARRHAVGRMIADEQRRKLRLGLQYRERRRLVGCKKSRFGIQETRSGWQHRCI